MDGRFEISLYILSEYYGDATKTKAVPSPKTTATFEVHSRLLNISRLVKDILRKVEYIRQQFISLVF